MKDGSGPAKDRLAGPIAGTILWLFLGPGVLIGLLPCLLSGWRRQEPPAGLGWVRWAGAAIFITAAPVMPTRHLVVTGTCRHVRNRGYIAVVSMTAGQALFLGNASVLVYAAVLALLFHLYVVLYEEPSLRRRFGAEYASYCRRVRRWLPSLRPDASTSGTH